MTAEAAETLAELLRTQVFQHAVKEFSQDHAVDELRQMREHIRSGNQSEVLRCEARMTVYEELLMTLRRHAETASSSE